MRSHDEDLPPGSAAETLRVIEQSRSDAQRRIQASPIVFFGPWGTAWFLGFGLMFLRFGPDGRVLVDMPQWLPLASLFALLVAAAVVSSILAARTFRHVRGRSATQGAMYGFTWFIAFAGMGMTLSRIDFLLPDAEASLLWASVAVLLTGALHMAGGAAFSDRILFGLGVWLVAVNILGAMLGPGWHSLVISLAGGAGMLLCGLFFQLRGWKAPS